MTDPTVLADALVEAGILFVPMLDMGKYGGQGQWYSTAEHAITDWRVAGKVLESLTAETLSIVLWTAVTTPGEPLPRAIIEAWYEARQ